MKVTLLGLGSGAPETITVQARKILDTSRLIIGAPRLLSMLPPKEGVRYISAVSAGDILARLQELAGGSHPAEETGSGLSSEMACGGAPGGSRQTVDAGSVRQPVQAAVVFSGDSGFYSGARLLLPLLKEQGYETEILPGISSVQMFSARLGRSWQEWRLVSAHGMDCDAVAEVMKGQPVFFLTGGCLGPSDLCAQLAEAGLGELPAAVGENLFLADEAVTRGTAGELAGRTFAPLSVLLAEPAPLMPRHTPGWPDDWFIRGQVPMTKQFVRAAILAKLAVSSREICWDVGAGTGSVSIELASAARRVYAVECKPEACELIRQNRARHNAWNLILAEGHAPEALKGLPAPDAVFIGGSRGELAAIADAVLRKNPSARLCIAAVTLETLQESMKVLAAHGIEAEIIQLAVSLGKAAGSRHLLTANNPVFLVTGNCK